MVEILGFFRVNKLKWTGGNIQYALLFLHDRMVFAKVGGQFADAASGQIMGATAGGFLGAIVGDRIEKKLRKSSSEKRNEKILGFSGMDSAEILALDKNNFEIVYKDISTIEVKKALLSITSP